jgi:hypothetical protein
VRRLTEPCTGVISLNENVPPVSEQEKAWLGSTKQGYIYFDIISREQNIQNKMSPPFSHDKAVCISLYSLSNESPVPSLSNESPVPVLDVRRRSTLPPGMMMMMMMMAMEVGRRCCISWTSWSLLAKRGPQRQIGTRSTTLYYLNWPFVKNCRGVPARIVAAGMMGSGCRQQLFWNPAARRLPAHTHTHTHKSTHY